jgi:hypothetical protein
MKKLKKLFSIVLALMLALAFCSCVRGNVTGTNGASVITCGGTSGSTQSTTPPDGWDFPEWVRWDTMPKPAIKDYVFLSDQKVFWGNIKVDGKLETKVFRIARLTVDKELNKTVTYIDVLDDDGALIASTAVGGYSFFAVSTEENAPTSILRYSFGVSGNSFTLNTTVGEFSNFNKDTGRFEGAVTLVNSESKSVSALGTEEGIDAAAEAIEIFSRESADLIENGMDKWNLILLGWQLYSPEEEERITTDITNRVRDLGRDDVLRTMTKYFENEKRNDAIKLMGEAVINAVLRGDSEAARAMFVDGIDASEWEKAFEGYAKALEGVETFKLENYYCEKVTVDGESFYSSHFKMSTNNGNYRVETFGFDADEKLGLFEITKDKYGNLE